MPAAASIPAPMPQSPLDSLAQTVPPSTRSAAPALVLSDAPVTAPSPSPAPASPSTTSAALAPVLSGVPVMVSSPSPAPAPSTQQVSAQASQQCAVPYGQCGGSGWSGPT